MHACKQGTLCALLLNAAACMLEGSQPVLALHYAAAAVAVDPRSPKAFYRAALAMEMLGYSAEALACCGRVRSGAVGKVH